MHKSDSILPGACPGHEGSSCLLLQPITDDMPEDATCTGCGAVLSSVDSVISAALRSAPTREMDPNEEDTVARLMKGVLPAPMPQPAPPNRLGPYEIKEKIGGGAMGIVYHARHVHLQTDFAVKVLKVARAEASRTVERFKREMRALGKMDHPNVVRATDAGEIDGQYFITMEYLEGTDLSKLVKRHETLPVPAACEIIRQAALGVHYAHENGVIHRDIKPSNLFLTLVSENEAVVKVLDLGLVRPIAEPEFDEDGDELTPAGLMLGTLGYMPPEQQIDPRAVSVQSDVFSLGVALKCLLTGSAVGGLPEEATAGASVIEIISKATAPLADDRYATALALAAALEPHSKTELASLLRL